jgi:hypothetical protein
MPSHVFRAVARYLTFLTPGPERTATKSVISPRRLLFLLVVVRCCCCCCCVTDESTPNELSIKAKRVKSLKAKDIMIFPGFDCETKISIS